MSIWDALSGEKAVIALAGFCGALTSGLAAGKKWGAIVIHVVAGTLTAYWLAPIGLPLFAQLSGVMGVSPQEGASVGAFLIGTGGSAVAVYAARVWRIRTQKEAGNGSDT